MRPSLLQCLTNHFSCIAVFLAISVLAGGCGKLKTTEEVIKPAELPVPPGPPPVAAAPVEKPPTPAEIVAKFLALPRTQKGDEGLKSVSEQTDQLANLTELDLAGTAITDTGAACLPKFTALKRLDLSVARVSARSLDVVATLPALETLRFGGIAMEDRSLTALQPAPMLAELTLNGTSIGENAFEPLAALEHLRVLEINDNKQMLGRTFTELVKQQRFRNLTAIIADSSGFGNYGLLEIGRLPNLEFLSVTGSMVGDESLQGLKGNKSLKRLYLGNNIITDRGLPIFKRLGQLEELRLSGNPAITDVGLKELTGLRQLKELTLDGTHCTAAGVRELKDRHLKSTKIHFAGQEL